MQMQETTLVLGTITASKPTMLHIKKGPRVCTKEIFLITHHLITQGIPVVHSRLILQITTKHIYFVIIVRRQVTQKLSIINCMDSLKGLDSPTEKALDQQ